MFTAESIFKIHHEASKYSPMPYELIHEQRKAVYERMATAINAEVQPLVDLIAALVLLLEKDQANDAWWERYAELTTRAQELLAQHIAQPEEAK